MKKTKNLKRQPLTEEQLRQMEELRQEVLKGVEQIRKGQSIVYNSIDELFDDIIKNAMKRREELLKSAKI